MHGHIPDKTNKVLNVILLGFLLILVRVWYLSIIQHEEHIEKARKPKRRTVIETVERATIRDRFNIPLALNKIQYNAAVCYADIRLIPSSRWEIGAEGKKVRIPNRLRYIQELSQKLATILQVDAQMIEDTIHGKASLFPHTPFVIKENISEKEYYQLKALEKDWAGIRMERGSQRYYPLGSVGCDLIGHLGAISSKEYEAIAQELQLLSGYLAERDAGEAPVLPKGFQNPLEVRERVKTLQEKSYTIHDLTGKTGVENSFDAELRGFAGKKVFEIDTKGNVLRALPGSRKGLHGQRLLLSISSELQQFAEELLIANESVRELRHFGGEPDLSAPWIKGGAIVAMDPNTGEILALASYPRVDLNDFIPSGESETRARKLAAIHKWLEDESYIGEIWDGRRTLDRERWDEYKQEVYTEKMRLSWEKYLEAICSPSSQLLASLNKFSSMQEIHQLQKQIQELLILSNQDKVAVLIEALYKDAPHKSSRVNINKEEKEKAIQQLALSMGKTYELKRGVDPILGALFFNDDKLLLLDLCHLLIDPAFYTESLTPVLREMTPSSYRSLNQAASSVQQFLRSHSKTTFHSRDFQQFRDASFKEILKEKRAQEKEERRYARPYTDYLEGLEKEKFKEFWQAHAQELLYAYLFPESSPQELTCYLSVAPPKEITAELSLLRTTLSAFSPQVRRDLLQTFRHFEHLTLPLYGRYRSLRHTKGVQLQKHLAAAFYPLSGYGYGRSQAYRQSTPQGSVFKPVVGYQALLEKYNRLKKEQVQFAELNPLTIIDNLKWHPKPNSPDQVLGSTLEGKPIIRSYKGGLLPRSSHPNIGKVDFLGALEQSSNVYFALLASDHLSEPSALVESAKNLGFGEKTGIDLPGEISGILPNDLTHNRTGLYASAIGQHSLVVTPLQTAVMLSALANKGHVLKPKVIRVIAGEEPLREYQDPFQEVSYPFKEQLSSIGIDFPLFTALSSEQNNPYIWYHSPEIKRSLFVPESIHRMLMEGLHRVVTGVRGSARPEIIRALAKNPQWAKHYRELKDQLVGKTGTAEILHNQFIDAESRAKIKNHIWFAGVSFQEEDYPSWSHPELTVVVYLRFSDAGGKEAAPLATEVMKKYREILQKHGQGAYALPQQESLPLSDL